ncbi:MAG TPA: TonB-dependent receptor [Bacteroidales bacterium]|nr:TonB-dependent receptor [Bacteroidales bacterium]
MKKLSLIILFFFNIAWLWGQKIQVIDRSTLQPIAGASVFVVHDGQKIGVVTNQRGMADISGIISSNLPVHITAIGYKEQAVSVEALEHTDYKVMLIERPYDLNEIVVSASRFEEKRANVPQQMMMIKQKDIKFLSQPTSAELLQSSGQVLVQKSQLGGGSPILRGFEANKVLLVVDGIRMNNAIYRGGHLQNIISIDNSMLEKVEVIYSPGSVVYGSDALGGVIHFHTLKPILAENGKTLTKTHAFTRYSTAYEEKTAHVDFNIGTRRFASLSSISVSDFGDLRQGDVRNPFYGDWGKRLFYVERIAGKDSIMTNENPNIQKGSAYTQYDFMQKFLFKQSEKVSHTLNLQFSTSSDINRYDRLTEVSGGKPKYAEWYYGPQKRLLAAYQLELGKAQIWDRAKLIAGYQNIEESRHNRSFGKSKLSHRTEKLDVFTLNLDFDKQIAKQEIRYGLEGTYNDVNSEAFAENINTGEISRLDTRYPDGGSKIRTLAAYVTHTWEINPKFILSDGLRYSNIYLNAKFNDTTFFPFPFNEVTQKSSSLNGNLGLTYMPGKDWRFTLLGSTGFRAPNVDDLAKVFESVPGSVIVPNPDLKPEYIWNAELGISKLFMNCVNVELTGYYTLLKDLLTVEPSLFNGQDSILYDGVLSRVTTSVNADEGYIYGLSGTLIAQVTDNLIISSTLHYTYGRIKTDTVDYPLDHIPPIYGKTSFRLNLNKFKGEFYVMYNGWKRLEDYNVKGEDNLNYATEKGMPAWYTLNLRTSWQIDPRFEIQLALENILDQNYRVFASGISAPGRNFSVTLRGNF